MAEYASRYRHKLVLLKRTLTQDPVSGQGLEHWTEQPPIHGSVEYLRGGELWAAGGVPQRQAQTEARIRIRSRRGLNPADYRLRWGPTVFDIQAVIPDHAHREIQLLVRARKSGQPQGGEVNP